MSTHQRLLDRLGNAIGKWLPEDEQTTHLHAAIDSHPDLDDERKQHMHANLHWSTVLTAAIVIGLPTIGIAVCIKALLAGNPAVMVLVYGPQAAGCALLWCERWPTASWLLITAGTTVGVRYLVGD